MNMATRSLPSVESRGARIGFLLSVQIVSNPIRATFLLVADFTIVSVYNDELLTLISMDGNGFDHRPQ